MKDEKRPGKIQFWKRLTKTEQKALRGGTHGGKHGLPEENPKGGGDSSSDSSASSSSSGGGRIIKK